MTPAPYSARPKSPAGGSRRSRALGQPGVAPPAVRHATPMQADLSALFEQIMAASPWPVLLLDETDAVLAASDEANAPRQASDDVALRARAAHYL